MREYKVITVDGTLTKSGHMVLPDQLLSDVLNKELQQGYKFEAVLNWSNGLCRILLFKEK